MSDFRKRVPRRTVLKQASAIALVGGGSTLLSACGGGGGSSTPTPTPPTAPTPTPPAAVVPITPTTNGTASLAPTRNSAQAVASTTWKNQLKIQITPVGAERPYLFDMSTQGQRMDDFVRPSGVGNSAYYRVDLGVAVPGLWVALHYSPATPFDNQPHASYVFEHQPSNRFRAEADSDRLNYTAQVIDAALNVNVTTAIGSAAATDDLKKLKHGQDQRWILQSRAWPSDTVSNTVPPQVTAGAIFDSVAFQSGGKSTTVVDSAPAAYVPLGSGSWSRNFTVTGGRPEIGPNGPAWVMKAIRNRSDADRTAAWDAIKPQFSMPVHAREKDGSMAFWKEGTGVDGLPNAEKQMYNAYGINGTYNAQSFSDIDNGGWQVDNAHRGNGMFAMVALQGGTNAADPVAIEEAAFFAAQSLNASSKFDRSAWGTTPGSVLDMAQGRALAWNLRDVTAARTILPAANVPNWLPTRADLDVVINATLDVLEANTNGWRQTFGLPTYFPAFNTLAPSNTTTSLTYEYLIFAAAFAFRNTGNARFKTFCQTITVNRFANKMLSSPKHAFGHDYGVTRQLPDGTYTNYNNYAEIFAANGKSSTAAEAWDSFTSPDSEGDAGDYQIALFEAVLIAKNIVGISATALDQLIALYQDKWLNNGKSSVADFYNLSAQWAVKTTA